MPLQGETQYDDDNVPIGSGYSPTSDRVAGIQLGDAVQDPQTGRWYAPIVTSGSGGGPVTAINGAFVAGAIVDLTSLLTLYGAVGDATSVASVMGRLAALKADLDAINTNTADLLADGDASATAALQTTGNTSLASIKTDLDNIYTQVQLLGTQVTAAAMKADLDTLVTNTADLLADGDASATAANQTTGNTSLASIATNTGRTPAQGAAATSASTPVNIASDQVVPQKLSAVAAYSLASITTTGSTQNSGDIAVGPYREISIDINTTAQAGTSPTIQYFYERKAADGIYYVLWQSAVLTAATNTLSTSIGAGMAYNQSLGVTGRLRWVVGGSATPTFTHSANLQGK